MQILISLRRFVNRFMKKNKLSLAFIAVLMPLFTLAQTVAIDSTTIDDKTSNAHFVIRDKFMEGGWQWMTPILLCFIFGLAIVIERIIYLNISMSDPKLLLKKIEESVKTNNFEAAIETCRDTKGPVATIIQQGLERYPEGIDVVEKSIIASGSVQMGLLERGLVWISLFISIAPMLGFLGTVVGMIIAFDDIEAAGDISPTIVAHGIKVALLTTVGGLIVAIILQVFYNYIISRIDRIVIVMEDASIALVDILVKNKK